MRHLTEKIVCCITAAAALLFCMAGCRAKLLMAETQEQCGTPTGKTTFKTEKPALSIKPAHDFPRMSPTSESGVHIDPVLMYVESVHALLEQHWYVVVF